MALARVLATDPTVLLFDEPLSALDKNLRDTLKYSILDLQRRTRKTTIYVTHDQSEAFAISDRIVVMNGGRIEQIGTQTDIYLHPQTHYVAEFIGANNGLPATVTGSEGSGEDGRVLVTVEGYTLRCRARDAFAVGDAVLTYVRPENITVLDGTATRSYENVLEGVVERVIFEGPTAQLRVVVGGTRDPRRRERQSAPLHRPPRRARQARLRRGHHHRRAPGRLTASASRPRPRPRRTSASASQVRVCVGEIGPRRWCSLSEPSRPPARPSARVRSMSLDDRTVPASCAASSLRDGRFCSPSELLRPRRAPSGSSPGGRGRDRSLTEHAAGEACRPSSKRSATGRHRSTPASAPLGVRSPKHGMKETAA